MEPEKIGPYHYGIIALDNNGYREDSCGSVSWQILKEETRGKWEPLTGDEKDDKGRRFNIAYFTSFR